MVGAELPYYPISAGKLRRYFDLKNLSDLRVLKECRRLPPPEADQARGGFQQGGLCGGTGDGGAWLLRIPVILHESDLTPGLANRLSLPFARRLCVTFPDTTRYLKGRGAQKAVVTGTPIRAELFSGSREEGLNMCRFTPGLPVLLVMGGSLGSAVLNEVIRENLAELTKHYQIIHLCGQQPGAGRTAATSSWNTPRRSCPPAGCGLRALGPGPTPWWNWCPGQPNILTSFGRPAGDQILNAASSKGQAW